MFGFPGHRFVEPDQSHSGAGNGFFPGMRHRFFVQVDAAGEIKNPVDGGGYKSSQVNCGHMAGYYLRDWIIWKSSTARNEPLLRWNSMLAGGLRVGLHAGAGRRLSGVGDTHGARLAPTFRHNLEFP